MRIREFCFFMIVSIVSLSGISLAEKEIREIPAASPLRKQLFEMARSAIQNMAGQSVKFQGSLKEIGIWAFFLGQTVDQKDGLITHPDSGSADTCILWKKESKGWSVIDCDHGFTDVFYANWPERYGVHADLLGLSKQ
jgi:hypothetical protein